MKKRKITASDVDIINIKTAKELVKFWGFNVNDLNKIKVKETTNLLFRNSKGETVTLDEKLTIGELTKMGVTVRLQVVDVPLEKGWYGEVIKKDKKKDKKKTKK